jgi:hypothetical protein
MPKLFNYIYMDSETDEKPFGLQGNFYSKLAKYINFYYKMALGNTKLYHYEQI